MFGEPRALPRGPHRLPREQVVASQRNRLLAATTAIVAEHGYSAATIAEISSRAGVSPKTFYEHFADKLDCFLTGYEVLVTTLVARMGASVTPDSSWPQFIASSLDAYLATLEDEPTAARAFVVEIEAAGPRARARRRAAYQQFADLLKGRHQAMRARDCALAALPIGSTWRLRTESESSCVTPSKLTPRPRCAPWPLTCSSGSPPRCTGQRWPAPSSTARRKGRAPTRLDPPEAGERPPKHLQGYAGAPAGTRITRCSPSASVRAGASPRRASSGLRALSPRRSRSPGRPARARSLFQSRVPRPYRSFRARPRS